MFFASSRHVESNPRTAAAIRAQRLREQEARAMARACVPVLPASKKPAAVTRPPAGKRVKKVKAPEPFRFVVKPTPVRAVSDAEIRENLERKWQAFLLAITPATQPDLIEPDKRQLDFDKIMQRICRVFRILPRDLMSSSRRQDLILPRQAVYYWVSRLTPLSYTGIGAKVGGRDHSTIMHGVNAYRRKRARKGRHLRTVREPQ